MKGKSGKGRKGGNGGNGEAREVTPPIQLAKASDDLQLELPGGKGDTRADLIQRQQTDQTLKECMLLGKEKFRGYELRNGMLLHVCSGELGEEQVRVVVPKADRHRLLELAHEYGGHLGSKKVKSKLNRLFT